MNRSEFIAHYEARAVLWAIIFLVEDGQIPVGPISSRQIKDVLEKSFECRVTVQSIEIALKRDDLTVAEVVSDAGEFLVVKFDLLDAQVLKAAAVKAPGSFAGRLQALGKTEFQTELKRERKAALAYLSQPWVKDQADFQLPSGHGLDALIHVLGGLALRNKSRPVTAPRKVAETAVSVDWSRSGAIAAWIAIPIAVLGILVAIWLAGKI